MYIIYSLKDPRTDDVKYVGRTSLERKDKRLYEHINYAHKNKTYSVNQLSNMIESKGFNLIENHGPVHFFERSKS